MPTLTRWGQADAITKRSGMPRKGRLEGPIWEAQNERLLKSHESSLLKFWRDYVSSLSADNHRQKTLADVFAFGDSTEMADQLAKLAREGVKTATCSALCTYEEEQKPLPERGDQTEF